MNKMKITNKTVAFLTLGCKVNTYDTEAMIEIFEKEGWHTVDFASSADVYVVNTCTVTHLGDRKSRSMLRRARRTNPNAIIVAMGCYVQVAPEEVGSIEEVDLIIGTQNRANILHYIEAYQENHEQWNFVSDIMHERVFENLKISETKGRTRAFIKVQEGCNQFCTYCIVPFARGPVRSRNIASVVSEVERVAAHGYTEVVLTGIHIASWGVDFDEDINLLDLIRAVSSVKGIKRIRLGSLEPLLMTEEFVAGLAEIESFCPHFHLSLQSGSNTVLKRMGRRYTTEQYAQIVERIRRYFKLPGITTDIMVGFPGETDEEFKETLEFVKQIGFYQVHVFKYSRRKGTRAAKYPNQIDEAVKNVRSKALIEAAHASEAAFLKDNDGQPAEVLFEKTDSHGVYTGHTPNYIPVNLKTDQKIDGKIVNVALSYNQSDYSMTGTLL